MKTVAPLLIDPPAFLYRFLDQADHAEALRVSGRLRLQLLSYYQQIEVEHARDESEGDGRLLVPGMLSRVAFNLRTGELREIAPIEGHFNFNTTWNNPTYVLCTSLPTAHLAGMLRDRPYPVSIFDPVGFAVALLRAAEALAIGERELFRLEGMPVRYDKDEVGAHPEDPDERTRLSLAQKHRRFEAEAEYRFMLHTSGSRADPPAHLDLSISSPERYCG